MIWGSPSVRAAVIGLSPGHDETGCGARVSVSSRVSSQVHVQLKYSRNGTYLVQYVQLILLSPAPELLHRFGDFSLCVSFACGRSEILACACSLRAVVDVRSVDGWFGDVSLCVALACSSCRNGIQC